ncbi:MAG: hypothetical protein RJA59_2187, partial [Pseudomonadota bacterium]
MTTLRSILLAAVGKLSRPRRGEGLLYYSQIDRKLHLVDDRGTDTALGAGGGGLSSPVGIADGGTGQTTQTAAFDALSPTTTKGDLIVSNGTDNVRQAVGADNTIPVADSTQTTGIAWAAGQTIRTAAGLLPQPTSERVAYMTPMGNTIDVMACQASNGGTSTVIDTDGYWRRFTTGNASGNSQGLQANQSNVLPSTGVRVTWLFRSDASLFTTNHRFWIGLNDGGTPGDVASPGVGTHCILLRYSPTDGDTKFVVYHNSGGSPVTSSAAF